MKNIVYFLGAGFSVPAGLPMISNFLFKARDQYFNNPNNYSSFKGVFEYIDGLSKAKNFTNIDLFNVEEIFSIADTHELLGKELKKDLQQFIKDVIIYHTPVFKTHSNGFDVQRNSFEILLGSNSIERYYIGFISSLCNSIFEERNSSSKPILQYSDIRAKKAANIEHNYQIITLNYDTLIEDSVGFINDNFDGDLEIPIAKLHGSVNDIIVPPTWNKSIVSDIEDSWRLAATWLSQANEIRILGYSLPTSDIYIKHLFSTALVESSNLQCIDVICLDSSGSVANRYNKLFSFPRYNFFNMDISNYLSSFTSSGYQTKPFKRNVSDTENSHRAALGRR